MTIEQIELRKMLTQMLADNGINRETIVDFVKGIVEEKVEKAIYRTVHEVDIDGMVRGTVRETTKRALQEEVSKKVRATLSSVSISLECHEVPKQREVDVLRQQVESLMAERDRLLRQAEASARTK
ncbi:hypothetical protein [Bacteroides acidifaciens]|uniref:hypothetical protein n=1 Tax=Bacteroides acidifaciens TaxID=85831 RepID=UPI0025A03176|nr:hypothetical protein [Bacteroides acidifaciens]